MNKYLVFLLALMIGKSVCAQWLPMNMVQSISSYSYPLPTGNEQMFVNDSMIYLLRYGGIESMNMKTQKVNYHWSGSYNAGIIKPDTGANFMVVKNDTQIVCYNFANDSFYNLPQPFSATINDLGRSNTYIWALLNSSIIARFNGSTWQYDTLQTGSYPENHLVVRDDSTAYIFGSATSKVYRFEHGAFNYSLPLLHLVRSNDPCEIDSRGNLWVADSTQLIKVDSTGAATTFNQANSPFNSGQAMNVLSDNHGNIWVTGIPRIVCQYNGQTWTTDTLNNGYYIYSGIDKQSDSLYIWEYNDWLTEVSHTGQKNIVLSNMPYSHITAINSYYIATNYGIFKFNALPNNMVPALIPVDFIDTARPGNPYAFEVTCLVNGNSMQYLDTAHAFLYGTRHGVYGLNSLIDNTQLPDTVINYLYYADSILYIGTNKGLCIFNHNTYTVFDTSNSPLPSNKITYITNNWYRYASTTDSILYVGTDMGLAVSGPTGWKIYDTAYFHLNNVHVTGIYPYSPYNNNAYDSTIILSTFGSGIISLKMDGSFTLCNKANGYLPTDTVYSISEQHLGSCGSYLVAGIPGSGIAFEQSYYSSQIQPFSTYINNQITLPDSQAFKYYAPFPQTNYYIDAIGIFSQGNDLAITFGGCEGIPAITAAAPQLKWSYENNTLQVFLPDSYGGQCTITVYDLEGRVAAFKSTAAMANDPVQVNVSHAAAGFYIVQANLNGNLLQTKAVITR